MATRLLVVKADGSVLVHSDAGGYKPLMWMTPPCTLKQEPEQWTVINKGDEKLVISIEEVGVFKTSPKVYARAVQRLGVPATAIAFVTANGWDAYAASAFGMRVVWCNRARQPRERLPGAPDRVIESLAELPALIAET